MNNSNWNVGTELGEPEQVAQECWRMPSGYQNAPHFPDNKGTSGSSGNSLKVNVGRCRHSSRGCYDIRMSHVRPVQAV